MPSPKFNDCFAAREVFGVVNEDHLADDAAVSGQVNYAGRATSGHIFLEFNLLFTAIREMNHHPVHVDAAFFDGQLQSREAAFTGGNQNFVPVYLVIYFSLSEFFPTGRLHNHRFSGGTTL